MKVISTYLFKTIISTTLLVFFLFSVLELFIFLMAELINVRETYGAYEITIYAFSMLPSIIYLSLPIILLLGSLIGLGRLASKNELVVMLTAGMSKLQITKIVLATVLILLAFFALWGEFLAPVGQHFAIAYKTQKFAEGSFRPSNQQIWLKENDTFLHIQTLLDKKQAFGISRFQFDSQNQLKSASYAEKAMLEKRIWQLKNIRTTQFLPDGKTHVQVQSEENWPVSMDINLLNLEDPRIQKNLWHLYQHIQYKKAAGFNINQDTFSFWQRLLQPFSTLMMIALGIPFIFGSTRKHSIGFRIMMGVVIALIFYTLNAFFGPISLIFDMPPLLAASLPTLLLLSTGSIALLVSRA